MLVVDSRLSTARTPVPRARKTYLPCLTPDLLAFSFLRREATKHFALDTRKPTGYEAALLRITRFESGPMRGGHRYACAVRESLGCDLPGRCRRLFPWHRSGPGSIAGTAGRGAGRRAASRAQRGGGAGTRPRP